MGSRLIIATAIAALLLGGADDAGAELKYTIHVESKKVEPAAGQPVHPMIAMMSDNMIKELLPEGSADFVYTIGAKGSRLEYVQAAMGQPAGTVALSLADGTMVGLNTKEQTYWKMTALGAADAMKSAGVSPDITTTRTGQFQTVAGVRCERVAFDIKVDLPIPDAIRASLPTDFPRSLALTGDSCLAADQYQKYAVMAAQRKVRDFLSELGMGKMADGSIPMRYTFTFGSIQLDQTVTAIAEEDVPDTVFEIPAGYKEVPAPAPVR